MSDGIFFAAVDDKWAIVMQSRDILKKKGTKVWCVQIQQSVAEALEILIQQKIGALVVLDEKDGVAGIISERDIMRVCFHNREDFDQLPVKKVMTKCVVVAKPGDPIDHLMVVMTQNRVRHLPVIEDGKLEGIVSIGDVVKARLEDSIDTNKQLMDYMFSH